MRKIIKAELSKYKPICEHLDKLIEQKKAIESKYDIKSPPLDSIPRTPIPQDKKMMMYIEEVTPINDLIEIMQKQRDNIIDYIKQLPQPSRIYVYEHYCLGYTLEEVAKKYHQSISSLRRKIDKEIERT